MIGDANYRAMITKYPATKDVQDYHDDYSVWQIWAALAYLLAIYSGTKHFFLLPFEQKSKCYKIIANDDNMNHPNTNNIEMPLEKVDFKGALEKIRATALCECACCAGGGNSQKEK
jgi:hypothetical protein